MTTRPEPGPLLPLLLTLSKKMPEVRIIGFDGSVVGPGTSQITIRIVEPAGIYQILRAPRGLGLARAWVTGQIDIEGDLLPLARNRTALADINVGAHAIAAGARCLPEVRFRPWKHTGPTAAEFRGLRPGRHTPKTDRREIDFHYGVGNEFYRILLGASMTYSCAIFPNEFSSLEDAQQHKHEIISRKLRVSEVSHVLDLGCGWGGFLSHLAEDVGCRATGITASTAQWEYCASRFAETTKVSVLHNDYRDVSLPDNITAIASVGMYEHVGRNRSPAYFRLLYKALEPGGLLLNQAIFRTASAARFKRNSFMERYIFPNGHIISLEATLRHAQTSGFTIESVECFGKHYARTLSQWRRQLRDNWELAVESVGMQRARAWLMYLAGSEAAFEDGTLSLAQVLLRKPAAIGR